MTNATTLFSAPLVSALALGLAISSASSTAHAGGFEMPANGTEALGRGGAFTAKADSPLAMEYNVAGLAQLRGTRLLFDNNLTFSNYTFQRAGGDSFGAFPAVSSSGPNPFYAPWFGLTTDFRFFRRLTFAIGAFGPSSIGKRSYGAFSLSDSGMARPSPARYDLEQSDLLIILPTIAVGIHVHRVFDIGIEGQQVTSQVNVSSATYAPTSLPVFPKSAACSAQAEVSGCDTTTRVQVTNYDSFMLQLGMLFHPLTSLHIGVNVRSAVNLGMYPVRATGTVSASEPPFLRGAQLGADHMNAQFNNSLPWVVRGGIRYALHKNDFEIFDIELDGTYEAWSGNHNTDNELTLLNPPPLVNQGKPLTLTIPHGYQDTFSLRLGGALNYPTRQGKLTLRLGAFYDSSATGDNNLRIDFDTLAKLGGTGGIGITMRGVTLNLAYAYVYSLGRTVTEGSLFAIDGTSGMPVQINGQQAPAVNNGAYSGSNQILSLGLSVLFDDLIRGHGWLADHPR